MCRSTPMRHGCSYASLLPDGSKPGLRTFTGGFCTRVWMNTEPLKARDVLRLPETGPEIGIKSPVDGLYEGVRLQE